MVRVSKSNINFCASIHPCTHRLSICPLCYLLLNHLMEYNLTCYITSPYGKGVQEQHYFLCIHPSSVSRLSIYLSCYLLLNHLVKYKWTCYITFLYGKGVREQHYPSVVHPLCYLLLNCWMEFSQTCYIISPHGKSVQEQYYFSMHPSVSPSVQHAISS